MCHRQETNLLRKCILHDQCRFDRTRVSIEIPSEERFVHLIHLRDELSAQVTIRNQWSMWEYIAVYTPIWTPNWILRSRDDFVSRDRSLRANDNCSLEMSTELCNLRRALASAVSNSYCHGPPLTANIIFSLFWESFMQSDVIGNNKHYSIRFTLREKNGTQLSLNLTIIYKHFRYQLYIYSCFNHAN